MTRDGGFAPVPLDGGACTFAQSLAERWRATGLGVSLDLPADEAGPGEHYYVLTARTPSRVLACTCQAWRRGAGRWSGRTLWTVAVKLRRSEQDSETLAGVAAARGHAAAWREVLAWIEGGGSLHPDHEEALAAALSAPRPSRRAPPDPLLPPEPTRSRAPVAAVGAVALLLLVAGGVYRAAHRTQPDAVDTAAARSEPQVATATSRSIAPAPEPPAPSPQAALPEPAAGPATPPEPPAVAPPAPTAPPLAAAPDPTPPPAAAETKARFAIHLASVHDPARVSDEWANPGPRLPGTGRPRVAAPATGRDPGPGHVLPGQRRPVPEPDGRPGGLRARQGCRRRVLGRGTLNGDETGPEAFTRT